MRFWLRYWITNSAVHAQWAVVFAQLTVAGRSEGIHGFLVRIRWVHREGDPGFGSGIQGWWSAAQPLVRWDYTALHHPPFGGGGEMGSRRSQEVG